MLRSHRSSRKSKGGCPAGVGCGGVCWDGVGWGAQGLGRVLDGGKRLQMYKVSECTHPPWLRAVCVSRSCYCSCSFRPTFSPSVPTPFWGLCSFPLPPSLPALPGMGSIVSSCPDVFSLFRWGILYPGLVGPSMVPYSLAHSYPCFQKWVNASPPPLSKLPV